MTVSEELKNKAIKLGLCNEWTNDWGEPSLDDLCEMYISGLDFCILNDYPSNEYIKSRFGKIAEEHGIFTDTEVNIENPDIAILNGECKGYITLTGFASRDIYVRHKSEVEIAITDQSRAFIRVYDKAKVKIINDTKSRIFVYQYGGTIEYEGDVLIRKKSLKDL